MTHEDIITEIRLVQITLDKLLQREAEFSLQELSLTKVSKLLGRSTDTVKRMVEEGELPAMINEYGDGVKVYRFLAKDIRAYQISRKRSQKVQPFDGKTFFKELKERYAKS